MVINEQIEQLHKCLVIIANEIKRICDKNGISYFLIAGTLLGAIRHGGIIPWDDDLDVGILRNEYDRFIQVCDRDLDDRFLLCTASKEKNYGIPFAKIRLKNTCFKEEGV